jgi:hypothetical protein
MSIVLQGSTSGSVTLQEPAVAGTTVLDLPATSGTVITTGSPQSGSVLQVVNSVKTGTQSTTSSSYVDITDLSVSITPKFATSKILVMARINNMSESIANGLFVNLVRNSTTITSSSNGGLTDTYDAWASAGGGGMTNNDRKISSCSIDYLDSPATTSATTYKMQMRADGNTVYVNRWGADANIASVSSITVMEIAV